MPFDERFYDIQEEEIYEIDSEQFVGIDDKIIENIELLTEYPFIIALFRPTNNYFKNGMDLDRWIDTGGKKTIKTSNGKYLADLNSQEIMEYYERNDFAKDRGDFYQIEYGGSEGPAVKPEVFVDLYPEHKEEVLNIEKSMRWEIVTLSEANKRGTDEMAYAVIAEFERYLSNYISDEYPNSSELVDHVQPYTGQMWEDDQERGLDLHITEYMYLDTMIEIAANTESILQNMGYKRETIISMKDDIKDLRNKVMHPTKTLARDQEELEYALEVISDIEYMIKCLD